jgi:hypothetical protein
MFGIVLFVLIPMFGRPMNPARGDLAFEILHRTTFVDVLYQVSENLTHVEDSRIGAGLIQHGKQLSEVCHGCSYPASS